MMFPELKKRIEAVYGKYGRSITESTFSCYTYYVNEFRFHGFSLPVEKIEGYLVISSDFISSSHISDPSVLALSL